MDNNTILDNRIDGNGTDISLEDILAEFKAEEKFSHTVSDESPTLSRPIVIDTMNQPVGEVKISSALDFIESLSDDSSLGKVADADSGGFESTPHEEPDGVVVPAHPEVVGDLLQRAKPLGDVGFDRVRDCLHMSGHST